MKTRPVLTQEDCLRICAAAEAEARRSKWIVAIAILDDGGHLLHFTRMDGATPANAAIAVEKGRTAMLKMPGILPVQGGVPIIAEGTCIGAVGVSGVQSHEDEQIAQAGIDAILLK
jgi:glc operon protein GlcG